MCIVAGCVRWCQSAQIPIRSKIPTNLEHTRAKWSEPTEQSETTYFDRGLYHQFDLTIKQMLLPDAVPTIFPLSKKAKDPQKRGPFEKWERIRVSLSRIVLT